MKFILFTFLLGNLLFSQAGDKHGFEAFLYADKLHVDKNESIILKLLVANTSKDYLSVPTTLSKSREPSAYSINIQCREIVEGKLKDLSIKKGLKTVATTSHRPFTYIAPGADKNYEIVVKPFPENDPLISDSCNYSTLTIKIWSERNDKLFWIEREITFIKGEKSKE